MPGYRPEMRVRTTALAFAAHGPLRALGWSREETAAHSPR